MLSRKHDHFLDPKSRPQNHQPCTCPDTYLVGPGAVGPSSSLRGTQIGFGGRWDPVGPSPSLRGTLHPVWVLQC